MQLSDFYPEFKGWKNATPDLSANRPPIPDVNSQVSQYLRAPLPLPMQYSGDTVKQFLRPGLSSFRNAPQSPSSFPAINSAAKSAVTAAIATAIANAPSSGGGGVTSVGLTAPSVLFVTPVSGSPITSAGVLALALAATSPNYFFAGPPGTQGVIAVDSVGGGNNVDGTRIAASLSVSTSASQANDFALLAMTNFSGGGTVVTPPDASWTQLQGLIPGTTGNLGVWWKSVPAVGAVSGTVGLSGAAGNMDIVGSIATVKSTGSPSSRQGISGSIAGASSGVSNTYAYSINLLVGSSSFVMIAGNSSGITDWIVTDSQNNQYTQVAFSTGQGTGPFPRSTYIFAAPSTKAAACTVTITYAGSQANASAAVFATEILSLAPAVFSPVFRPIVSQDLPGFGSGKLDVFHGGTGANLTGTGGVSQFLRQASVGAAITVVQPDFSDLAGIALPTKYKNISLVSNGFPAEYAQVNNITATANIAATTLYAVPAAGAGLYRLSYYVIVNRVATTSSTLPDLQLTWTDQDNSVAQTFGPVDLPAGTGGGQSSANSLTTLYQGSVVVSAKASTNIQYQTGVTTAYASSGATTMQYSVRLKLEAL